MLSNRVDWRIFLFELKYPALGYKTVVNWSRPFFTIDNYNVYQFPISFAPSYPEPWSRPSSVKPSYQYHLELLSSLLIGLLSDMLPLSTWNKPEKGPLWTPPLFDTWSWNQYKAVFAGLPHSSNQAEGCYNGYKSLVPCNNPSLWKFVGCLNLKQVITDTKIASNLNRGDPSRRQLLHYARYNDLSWSSWQLLQHLIDVFMYLIFYTKLMLNVYFLFPSRIYGG